MKLSLIPCARWVAALAGVFLCSAFAPAALLVYEPFAYNVGDNLSGKTGGTGFAAASSWATTVTSGNSTGFLQVKPTGSVSGVILNDGATPNPYTNTFTYFNQSGNYVGMNDGGVGSTVVAPGVADHLYMSRPLAPSVTATFANGNTTYFSFASVRGYNANARAPSFAIGPGILSGPSRADNTTPGAGNSSSEAIAVGGITNTAGNIAGSTWSIDGVVQGSALGGVSVFRAQHFSSTGTRTFLSGAAGTVGGAALSSVAGTGSQPGDHGYWMQGGGGATSLLYGYSSASPPTGKGDNASHVNITVGKIEWGAGAGGTDRVSFYVFHDLDPISESVFEAGKLSWDTPSVSNKANYNYVSVGGGRYFLDEIRVATTFNEALGVPVPEPSTWALAVLGIGGLFLARRRK